MSDNSTSTSFGPVGETSSEIMLEKTFLASGYLTGVGFGIQLVLWWLAVVLLYRRKAGSRLAKIMIPYLTLLNVLNFIWTATSAYGLQLTFIDNRNYPDGGVITFLGVEFALPNNIVSLASYIAGNILADTLMIWRYLVILQTFKTAAAPLMLALPVLMLLGSFVMSIMFAIQTTGPPGLFAHITAQFGTPYFCLSMSLNIVLSLLILFRALFGGSRAEFEHESHSLGAILVESNAFYSVISFLLMVTFALGNPINQIWLGIAPAVQTAGIFLIFIRVARDVAFGSRAILGNDSRDSPAHLERASTNDGSSIDRKL